MKVLLVTLYFPPAGGGGVQRPLKFATHLPELGIETHVLAPDDPKWIHRDDELQPPTLAWVHRARYLGPKGRKPAEELHGTQGLERVGVQARLAGRRLLVPDENVSWNLTAIPAAIRIVKREGIDVVITTSPPSSVHLVGAAVKRATGIPWVADLRDSIVAHPHRARRAHARAREGAGRARGRAARRAHGRRDRDRVGCDRRRGARARSPRGPVETIANGSDFDDFAGLEHQPVDRFRITHAGSFFGKRDPRPFLTALARSGLDDVVVRFLGDFRSTDREWAEAQSLGDRLELIPYAPRRHSLELQRDSEALLLLIPEAGGRGKGVLSGKVFEYLAAERPILAVVPPDGAAAELIRDGRGRRRRRARRRRRHGRARCATLHARWRAGTLAGPPLSEEWRTKVSRRTRVEELARLLGAPDETGSRAFSSSRASSASRSRRCTGTSRAPSRSPTFSRSSFSRRSPSTTARLRVPRTTAILIGFFAAFLVVYLAGYFDLSDSDALAQWGKGLTKWVIHFAFLACAVVWLSRRGQHYFWRTLGWFSAGIVVNAAYGVLQLLDARARRQPRRERPLADHGRRQPDQHLRRDQQRERLSAERPDRRSQPPRDHADRAAARPDAALPAARAGHPWRRWLMLTIGFLLVVEAATLSRSGILGLAVGALVLAVPYRRHLRRPELLVPIGGALAVLLAIVALAAKLLHDGAQVTRADERRLGERALPGLQLHPARARTSTRCSDSG